MIATVLNHPYLFPFRLSLSFIFSKQDGFWIIKKSLFDS